MGEITKISVQQNNKNRSNIFIDGEYYCSLDNFTVLEHRLKVGGYVESSELDEIMAESDVRQAFNLAVDHISKFRKTKKQLSDYLTKKGYSFPVVSKVIDKLVSYGYLSDAEYAESYVKANCQTKGKLLLKSQLRAKGIDEKTADRAINAINDETESCIALAKKYAKGKELDFKNKQKCYRHLLAKGFSFESAKSAVDEVFNSTDDY